ncbi:glycerol kinase GlpK [Prolixibacter sp. SD074]|jgi:glycerol kinase|uniref:glycerol kinase GlpK n=1 Tax=Prolixibacter sp. SD074 TaxID=2652391 RepID=UPI00127B47D0|nr:glycerol kinase GlpK [Prolixibacter sp. SD074]GET29949.1 glycerol kinase [Prolixibacter sp. SD074]
METYILALDQGTTSSRAILFNHNGEIKSSAQKEFAQIFPETGWVEHDPMEIWSSQVSVAAEAMSKLGINGKAVSGIGITNQRETTIVWDRKTGAAVYNAIVWQDRRTSKFCDELKEKGLTDMIREKTGLIPDAYFSGTKVKWILDNVDGVREKAEKGELAFGTVDSWLVWNLTEGRTHITDVTNASRTMLFNINTLEWDEELLELLNIPKSMLPEVKSSSEIYDYSNTTFFAHKVPIAGIAGDQQAAMFGQMCIEEGMVKNTYGTGCFILLNTGDKPFYSKNKLVTTIAWKINGKVTYALEGSIFIGGAVVQWLRDGLRIINTSSDVEALAKTVEDNGDVFFVPAFTGMGAPHWDQYARGTMVGISRGTNRGHIARAALEGIAFQTLDVLEAMRKDTAMDYTEIRVDGGASNNNLLMQFQSDILDKPVERPMITETTALGAAYLAGLATGFWENVDEIKQQWQIDKRFTPEMDKVKAEKQIAKWKDAVSRAKSWVC